MKKKRGEKDKTRQEKERKTENLSLTKYAKEGNVHN
jgi:hypothetical protein